MSNICEVCGQPLQIEIIDVTDDVPHYLCQNCAAQRHSCNFCTHGGECSFQTDPSPLPKVITQTTQNGNMIIQQQVLNPERVEITCKKFCDCFSPDFGCLRQFNTCGNHAFTWKVGQHE